MKEIKILGIEKKQRSKKYKLITSDEEYTVSEDMIIKYQLFKEKTFTEKEFKLVIEDILEDEYFNKIINLLSISLKSEYEIIQYIHTNEIKNKVFLKEKQIQNIIKKLKQLNYIDDNKLCISLIDYYIRNNKGPLYIKQKLKEKKIDESLINTNLLVYTSDIEEEIIVKIINKETNKNLTIKKFKLNLTNKLLRNGFSSNIVYKLVDKLDIEDNSAELIEKDYIKALNKVSKKDKTDFEKKQIIINYLLSKGYEYKLIKEYLNNSSNK